MAIIFGSLIVIVDLIFLRDNQIFIFLLGISVVIVALPFLVGLIFENQREKEKNDRFLEFTRNLAASVRAGNPVGKSIINMREKNLGQLTPHVIKLANQIELGIPIGHSLETFARDIGTPTIKRAVALIREAENAGGQIDNILESVATSVYEIEKLKKERRAAISNLIVQGYIIFFIFIGIMLVMQFKILPLTTGLGSIGNFGDVDNPNSVGTPTYSVKELSQPFLYLLVTQGLFAGLIIGKLAEGKIKAGVKHSFILAVTAFLVSSGANFFL